jgi:hypothetical protein
MRIKGTSELILGFVLLTAAPSFAQKAAPAPKAGNQAGKSIPTSGALIWPMPPDPPISPR